MVLNAKLIELAKQRLHKDFKYQEVIYRKYNYIYNDDSKTVIHSIGLKYRNNWYELKTSIYSDNKKLLKSNL